MHSLASRHSVGYRSASRRAETVHYPGYMLPTDD